MSWLCELGMEGGYRGVVWGVVWRSGMVIWGRVAFRG